MLHKYKTDDTVQKYEFEIEDGIYKMLRNELVITNNRYYEDCRSFRTQ